MKAARSYVGVLLDQIFTKCIEHGVWFIPVRRTLGFVAHDILGQELVSLRCICRVQVCNESIDISPFRVLGAGCLLQ